MRSLQNKCDYKTLPQAAGQVRLVMQCLGYVEFDTLSFVGRLCVLENVPTLDCATRAKSAEPGLWIPTPGSTKVRALEEEPDFFRCCLRARLEGEGEGAGEAVGDALDPASDQLKEPLHGCQQSAQHFLTAKLNDCPAEFCA